MFKKINSFFYIYLIFNIFIYFFLNKTNKIFILWDNSIFPTVYIDKIYGLIFTIISFIIFFIFNNLISKIMNNERRKTWLNILKLGIIMSILINLSFNVYLSNFRITFIISSSIFICNLIYYYSNLGKYYRIIKIPLTFVKSENTIYMNFQKICVTLWVYISFIISIYSIFINLLEFIKLLIIYLFLETIIKNAFLWFLNKKLKKDTNVTIIRHGQTDANKNDMIQGITNNPLNNIGIKQANSIVDKVDNNYDVFITSPLKRSYKTLDIICTKKKIFVPYQVNELCIERNFGSLENTYRDRSINNFFGDYSGIIDGKKITNFESNKQLLKRSKKFIKHINKFYCGNNIILVSHSHFIKSLLTTGTGQDYFNSSIPNCSISKFDIYNNEFDLLYTDIKKN